MKLLDIFRRKEEPEVKVLTGNQRRAKLEAIESHKKRIANLRDEFELCSINLEFTEGNFDLPKMEKQKKSDRLICRMAMLRYEIEIREGLVKWLS